MTERPAPSAKRPSDWVFIRVVTATGSIYTVGLFRNRFGVLRGFSAELGQAVDCGDTNPLLDGEASLFSAPAHEWPGHQLQFGSIRTASIVDSKPECDERLMNKILAKYGVGATVTAVAGIEADKAEPKVTSPERAAPISSWLEALPEGGVRRVFEQIASHGAVTEVEAAKMLGGQRALRRFAKSFEEYARLAPFTVQIQVVAGVKRYSRMEDEG